MRRLVYKPSALSNYLIRIQSEKWDWPRAKWVLNAAACAVRRPRTGVWSFPSTRVFRPLGRFSSLFASAEPAPAWPELVLPYTAGGTFYGFGN